MSAYLFIPPTEPLTLEELSGTTENGDDIIENDLENGFRIFDENDDGEDDIIFVRE